MSDPILCFVDGPSAYFTTRKLAKQWGDDWGDSPYEYNAGEPYAPNRFDEERGEGWEIVEVGWRGPFLPPCDDHLNSPYSVEDINRGAAPWLRSRDRDGAIPIWAGTPLSKFETLLWVVGGEVTSKSKRPDKGEG